MSEGEGPAAGWAEGAGAPGLNGLKSPEGVAARAGSPPSIEGIGGGPESDRGGDRSAPPEANVPTGGGTFGSGSSPPGSGPPEAEPSGRLIVSTPVLPARSEMVPRTLIASPVPASHEASPILAGLAIGTRAQSLAPSAWYSMTSESGLMCSSETCQRTEA